jgi:hypothetical protein
MENVTRIRDVNVYIGTYGNKWIAATGNAPYFCLEADSAKDLDGKLSKLVAFLRKAADHLDSEREDAESKTFVVTKKIRLKELEDA